MKFPIIAIALLSLPAFAADQEKKSDSILTPELLETGRISGEAVVGVSAASFATDSQKAQSLGGRLEVRRAQLNSELDALVAAKEARIRELYPREMTYYDNVKASDHGRGLWAEPSDSGYEVAERAKNGYRKALSDPEMLAFDAKIKENIELSRGINIRDGWGKLPRHLEERAAQFGFKAIGAAGLAVGGATLAYQAADKNGDNKEIVVGQLAAGAIAGLGAGDFAHQRREHKALSQEYKLLNEKFLAEIDVMKKAKAAKIQALFPALMAEREALVAKYGKDWSPMRGDRGYAEWESFSKRYDDAIFNSKEILDIDKQIADKVKEVYHGKHLYGRIKDPITMEQRALTAAGADLKKIRAGGAMALGTGAYLYLSGAAGEKIEKKEESKLPEKEPEAVELPQSIDAEL